MIKFALFLLLLVLFAQPSSAEVYKWVDDAGVTHFTDDFTQVPEKHRKTIEKIETEEEGTEPKTQKESPPKTKEDAYRDRLGRGEDYWKARKEELNKKIQGLREKVENLRVKYNELTEKFNSSKSSVERANLRNEREQIKNQMDQYKAQISEAQEMLEKRLPEEAELYKAKPEWVKP